MRGADDRFFQGTKIARDRTFMADNGSSMRKLAGQTATYGVSSVLARLLSFSLTPFLTRIMTQGQYGAYTDMYALIPFALVLLTMGMESGYFRFAGKAQGPEDKKRVFATTWGAVSLVSVIFFLLVLLFIKPIAGATGYADRQSYIWIVGAIIMLDAVSALPYARLREQGRAGRYALIRTVSVVITVALCFFFYGLWPKLSLPALFPDPTDPGYAFLANLISSFLTLAILIPHTGGIAPRIERKLLKIIFFYSLPLLISGIAGTANEYIDRQLIKYLMPAGEGEAALGVYGAVAKIASLMVLFSQMYKFAAEPFFLAEFKHDDFKRQNARAMKYFLIVSIFIFLVLALFPDIIGMLLGRDFRGGMTLLPIMLLSNIMTGVILNLSFWYKQQGKTKYSIAIAGTGLGFTLAFNILLIPILGILGAAIARLICECAMVSLSYYLNRKHYPIDYDLRRIGGYALIGAVIYGAAVALSGLTFWIKHLVYLAFIAIFVVYAVRREDIDVMGLAASVLKRKKK